MSTIQSAMIYKNAIFLIGAINVLSVKIWHPSSKRKVVYIFIRHCRGIFTGDWRILLVA